MLPPGWSQHAAPNGQVYYFNASTGQSTHAHPATFPPPMGYSGPPPTIAPVAALSDKKPKKEKPKQKDPIPSAPGWLRVTTNLGNVFYTHVESKRSEWTIPDEIKQAVEEMENAQAANEESADQADPVGRVAAASSTLSEQTLAEGPAEDLEPRDEGKRKREEVDLEIPDDPEPGIDVAELLGGPAIEGEEEAAEEDEEEPSDEPASKKQRTSSTREDGEGDDNEGDREEEDLDEDAWQRQLATEMAAEANEEVGFGEPSSSPVQALSRPPPPSAPPQPPMPPAPSSFQPPPPPPGGYRGPPPGLPPPATIPKRPLLTVEEGKALFVHMLWTLNGTPNEVNPMAPWDNELPKFVHLSDYTALANLRDRQDAFNDWCKMRLREKREQKKAGIAPSASTSVSNGAAPAAASSSSVEQFSSSPADAYKRLLTDHVKSTRARFDDFRKEFKKDRRFYGFGRDDREREKQFKAHLKELGEVKRKAAETAERNFLSVLGQVAGDVKETRWVSMSEKELKEDVWPKIKKMGDMERRQEYDAVGSSSLRAELFVKWAKGGSATMMPPRPAETASPSVAGDTGVSKPRDAIDRREKALRHREEQVRVQRQEVERKNRRALGEATRGDSAIHFGELLVDAVRDPLSAWSRISEQLAGDARFEAPGLGVHQKRQMFDEHVAKLTSKKREQLRAIFLKYAPALDAEAEVVLPLVRDDVEYERLKMGGFVSGVRQAREEEALLEEWRFWKREREARARAEFDEMLKENSFVDFWGRLRSEAERKASGSGREEEATTQKLLGETAAASGGGAGIEPTDDEDADGNGEGAVSSLVDMANQVDIEEIHSILRNDQRYRAWRHEGEARDRWIRDYLSTLGGRKQTVFQTDETGRGGQR
ncbi:hypothetical protein BCV69DRAFT_281345 [Microstroma glucosiphilum]|uniref:WW domain-containing protein n=1 Tax=Pseudomicrostroma glucosiphilum TaxID=1684307 RepID=A0A316UB07_9BASI|nr:hypothetical protein BCV69DRAFT_281345 [Pseudomicrostroma glucosiphilum]PWN22342.1 hypothetical protein BCV69DRAFT_281345 [Pseudomicrostroma glucosiphilum]